MEYFSYCRLCALPKDDITDVKSEFGIERDLQKKISICFSLDMSVTNPLPRGVCMDCCGILEATWSFRETVEKAQHALRFIFCPNLPQTSGVLDKRVVVKMENVIEQNNWCAYNSSSISTNSAPVPEIDNKTAYFTNTVTSSFTNTEPVNFNTAPVIFANVLPVSFDKTAVALHYGDGKSRDSDRTDNINFSDNDSGDFDRDFAIDVDFPDLNFDVEPPKPKKKQKSRSLKKTSGKTKRIKTRPNEFYIQMWGLNRNIEDRKFVNEYLHDLDETERVPDGEGLLKPFKYRPSWRGYPWVCTMCEMRHVDINRLRCHWNKVHKEHLPLKCFDCKINIKDYFNFIMHVRTHKDRKHLKFCCDICFAYYESTKQLNAHRMKTHTPDKPHLCHRCWTGFDNISDLHAHGGVDYKCAESKKTMDRNLQKKDQIPCIFICEICNRVCKNKPALVQHMLRHKERTRDHTCDQCGKAFYNKGTLKAHFHVHQELRPHKCLICGKAFKDKPHLRKHAGTHVTIKPFTCDECGRSFRLKSQLISHTIIHTDELPHVCAYCGKAFRFRTLLTQHLRQHTGVRPYNCMTCQREFSNWGNWNKHMKRRHGMNMSKKQATPNNSELVRNTQLSNKLIILLDSPEDANDPQRLSEEPMMMLPDRPFINHEAMQL